MTFRKAGAALRAGAPPVLLSTFVVLSLCLSTAGVPARSQDDGAAILARVRQYHNELKDMSATMKVEHENNAALSKISPDFAEFVKYGFRSLKYNYKNPDKVRMESNAQLFGLLRGISVRNGGQKNFYVPTIHIHKSAEVNGQANKKETALDFGVLAGDVWDDYQIWYERTEKWNGSDVYVLAMRPVNEPHGGTMIVRLDPVTLKVLERERYSSEYQGQGHVVQQRQFFSNYIHPLPHVWIPTLIKLYNNKGEFGGDLVYSSISVNTNLPDTIFR